MKVLIACEYSGIVRDAFMRKGHDALSCDLLPTEREGPHYQGDVRDVLGEPWDMMIAFPPCTYLCNAGMNWINREEGRKGKMEDGMSFVDMLYSLQIPKIAIENPPGILSTKWRKPDQIIHPWMFGHAKNKPTCLWLKNLPPLMSTCVSLERELWVNNLPKSPNRWKIKSKTFDGIALAMSEQWG